MPYRWSADSPVILPWLVGEEGSLQSYRRHADRITHISPTWLRLDADSELHVEEQPEVRELASQHRNLLCPLVVNERFDASVAAAILGSRESRRRAVAALHQYAGHSGADGINLDLEGPFGEHRENYVLFVEELAHYLRKDGKHLSVDVVGQTAPPRSRPPETKPGEWVSSWADPYDYEGLGKLVDLFVIMGYDYHSRLSEPGPVGPYWWLRQVLEYTLDRVPPEKVVLGLPFYGRRWSSLPEGQTPPPGASPASGAPAGGQPGTATGPRRPPRSAQEAGFGPAEGLSYADAARLAKERGITPAWDEEARTLHFEYLDEDGSRKVVYFDDARSLQARSDLIREFGLAGLAFWRLGQEDTAVWEWLRREELA